MTPSFGAAVPLSKRLAYAAPAFALAVVGIPVYVYLPKFYTDVVGVDVATVGIVLLAVRVFDGVIDPLVGMMSDRTRTRFGRRRPYLALASVPLAASIVFLFVPPEAPPAVGAIWFATGLFALFFFWTLVTVPYESLGAEISLDYDERTALLGLRDGMLIAGTLAAACSPLAVRALLGLGGGPAAERATWSWIAALYAPLVIGACWLCAGAILERAPAAARSVGLGRSLRATARNRPFWILLASYTVSAFGSNLPATLMLYYVEYVLRAGRPEVFLLLYFVAGIAFLPAWVALSARVGKRTAWLSSIAINTGAFAGVYLLGPGDVVAYGILVTLSGIGFGATLALPSAIQADVIDYDELLSGRRREGVYVGLWSVARKLAAVLGVGAALAMLGAAGYTPNAEQPPAVYETLRVLYALVPSVCSALAFAVALFYPIDRERHAGIRRAIDARREGRPAVDPLRPGMPVPAAVG